MRPPMLQAQMEKRFVVHPMLPIDAVIVRGIIHVDVAAEAVHPVVLVIVKARVKRMAPCREAKVDHRGPRAAIDQGEVAVDTEADI